MGAHKWINYWKPAVEKLEFDLMPIERNLIDEIWLGEDRKRNQEPLEILPLEFSGICFSTNSNIMIKI